MSSSTDGLSVAASAAPASAGVATFPGGPLSRLREVRWGDMIGIAPFLIFALLFLVIPTFFLVVGAFVGRDGGFTFQNIIDLGTPQIISSFWISIRVSAAFV